MKPGRTIIVAAVALACALLVPCIQDQDPPAPSSGHGDSEMDNEGSPVELPVAPQRAPVSARDAEVAWPADVLAQSGFGAEERKIAVELLRTPGTYLARCEIREVTLGGSHLKARLLEGSPPSNKSRLGPMLDAIAGGESFAIFDNREDARADHPSLPAASACCVGDRRWMVIRKVLWRQHLLMAAPAK